MLAWLPGANKESTFLGEETDLLTRLAKAQGVVTNGDGRARPKASGRLKKKKKWSEIAAIMISYCGITNTDNVWWRK